MPKVGAADVKFNLFWLVLPGILLQRICSGCFTSPGCRFFTEENKYSCSKMKWNESNFTNWNVTERQNTKIIEICYLYTDVLDLRQIIEDFPNVNNVTIWKGAVNSLSESFLPENEIKILQLKQLSLKEIPDDFLESLQDLELLDLSGNHLHNLSSDMVDRINQIPQSKLSDNHWNCSLNLDWVLQLNASSVKDIEEMKCYRKPYPDKPLIPIALFKHNVKTNCPPECECSMPDVVRQPSNFALEPIIEVNCSDRGLLEFPSILPAQTKILMLERNKIHSLAPLRQNPVYRVVQDLYLDNNFVTAIKELEGSYWLSHFRVLSLRNNNLIQLATYALDNALQRNPNMPVAVRIYLGGNPWKCDCTFTPGFQEMLQKYETQVKDMDDIRCSRVEDDENSMALILKLSRSSVCRLPSEYTVQALDLLNGILATLIVLILGKLAYDYYHFKKTGRLPWIVTKMP